MRLLNTILRFAIPAELRFTEEDYEALMEHIEHMSASYGLTPLPEIYPEHGLVIEGAA